LIHQSFVCEDIYSKGDDVFSVLQFLTIIYYFVFYLLIFYNYKNLLLVLLGCQIVNSCEDKYAFERAISLRHNGTKCF